LIKASTRKIVRFLWVSVHHQDHTRMHLMRQKHLDRSKGVGPWPLREILHLKKHFRSKIVKALSLNITKSLPRKGMSSFACWEISFSLFLPSITASLKNHNLKISKRAFFHHPLRSNLELVSWARLLIKSVCIHWSKPLRTQSSGSSPRSVKKDSLATSKHVGWCDMLFIVLELLNFWSRIQVFLYQMQAHSNLSDLKKNIKEWCK